jgi:hypothetical protein
VLSTLRRPGLGLVTGLVVLQTVVLLLVRPNPRWNDGIFMLNYAKHFPNVPANHYTLRVGLVLPTRLAEWLFGYGQVAYYIYPFLCSLLLVVATYLVGRVLFGLWAGALAGLLVIFNPILVETVNQPGGRIEQMTSWQLLPDIPSTAFFTLGLALLLIGIDRASVVAGRRRMPAPGWLVAAALAFGWAYLIRETIPFLFPIIALVLLLWRVALRGWLWLAGTMIGCFAFELILNAALYGSATARFHAGSEQGGAPVHPLTRIKVLKMFPTILREYPATIPWLIVVALTVLTPFVVRRREYVVPAAWAAVYWFAMLLLSGFLNPRHIIVQGQLPRYWVPIVPALALGGAGALIAIARRLGPLLRDTRSRLVASVVIAAGVLAAVIVPVGPAIADNPRDSMWNAVRAYLHQHDAEVTSVVTDDRDALTLSVYQHNPVGGGLAWHADIVQIPHFQRSAPPPSAGSCLIWTSQLSKLPPAADSGWQQVFSSHGLILFQRK